MIDGLCPDFRWKFILIKVLTLFKIGLYCLHGEGKPESKGAANMNEAKINELKTIAAAAGKAYDDEKARLVGLGLKSQARYELLKPLKVAADKEHAEYAKFAKGQISKELDKIISADLPNRQAAARARSPWKQAKYDAYKGRDLDKDPVGDRSMPSSDCSGGAGWPGRVL